MSSVLRFLSQPTPNKRYVTEGTGTGLMYNIAGGGDSTVPAHSVLRDMGKTVLIGKGGGTLLRKVQIIPVASGDLPLEFRTGYIYLENVPEGQNIVALN
jgi:hypothetical protein